MIWSKQTFGLLPRTSLMCDVLCCAVFRLQLHKTCNYSKHCVLTLYTAQLSFSLLQSAALSFSFALFPSPCLPSPPHLADWQRRTGSIRLWARGQLQPFILGFFLKDHLESCFDFLRKSQFSDFVDRHVPELELGSSAFKIRRCLYFLAVSISSTVERCVSSSVPVRFIMRSLEGRSVAEN